MINKREEGYSMERDIYDLRTKNRNSPTFFSCSVCKNHVDERMIYMICSYEYVLFNLFFVTHTHTHTPLFLSTWRVDGGSC